MSIGEQVVLRIVMVFLIFAVVIVFRVVVALIKKGWNALVNPRGKNPVPQKPVKVVPPVQVPQAPEVRRQAPPVPPQPRTPEFPSGELPLENGPVSCVTPSPDWFYSYLLRCLNGPLAGSTYSLRSDSDVAVFSVGRNPGGTVVFPANTGGVSGNHCQLCYRKETNTVTLRDMNSTYGTYFSNGQRLNPGQEYPLQEGTVFLLAGPNGPAFRFEKQ